MNLADAQAAARKDPKIRAAVAISGKKAVPGAGITDDPDVEVSLFRLVRDAEKEFKEQKELLEAVGYVVTYGTTSRGLLILECGDNARSMSLIKRPAKDPSKGGETPSAKATTV